MTKIKFLLFALLCGVLTFQTTSCSSSDDDNNDNNPGGGDVVVTGITLDQSALSVQVGTTATIAATLQPLGAVANVNWSTSDNTVATVSNSGVVTGVKAGTATIVATVGAKTTSCTVTVTSEPVVATDNSLSGSNYYLITLDGTSFATIESKVIKDLRPDGSTKELQVWPDGSSFSGGTSTGKNFYGLSESWVSLVVGNIGWSGAGWFIGEAFGPVDMSALKTNPEQYYLHIGYKTSQTDKSWAFVVAGVAKFAIGKDYKDGDATIKSIAPITANGKWQTLEVPVTKINELGYFFNEPLSATNILAVLGGADAGTTVDLDAIFFYKK